MSVSRPEWKFLGGLVLLALAAIGVIQYRARFEKAAPVAKAAGPGDKVVLARVGNTTITQFDLELAAATSFSKSSRRKVLEGAAREKFLESLIQARAIALLREQELSPEEKTELDRRTARHREELLVKQYLIAHKLVEPSSPREVREYYDTHREEFGAAPVRTYEIVAAEQRLSGPLRDALIKELGRARAEPDWFAWAKRLKDKGQSVVHRRGELALGMMQPQLATVAERLKPGDATDVTMIDGRPHVVRLISESKGNLKPFEEVAGEIRERLSPMALSQAAKKASETALKQIEVVRY